jgi:hypothetical protein
MAPGFGRGSVASPLRLSAAPSRIASHLAEAFLEDRIPIIPRWLHIVPLDEKPHDILEERSARRNVKLSESFEKRVRPFEMEMWVRRFSRYPFP